MKVGSIRMMARRERSEQGSNKRGVHPPPRCADERSESEAVGATVCVTCVWAGVDKVWEQEKLEARKMLENAAESHTSGARFVGRSFSRIVTMLDIFYVV